MKISVWSVTGLQGRLKVQRSLKAECRAQMLTDVELTDPRGGANADYQVMRAANIAKKPRGLSFEAAAVPVAGGTAYAALVPNYRADDMVARALEATEGEGVDVVLDAGGKQTALSVPALKLHGHLVTVTGAQGDLNMAMRKDVAVHFTHLEDAKTKLDLMRPLSERGLLRSVVSATHPLAKVAEAHKRLEGGGEGTYGKVVIEASTTE